MEDSLSLTVVSRPPVMITLEERLNNAAENGDTNALYEVIQEKADFLKQMDEMEFVNTPLHIAAAAGHTEFVMELVDLKPSFATKLNQEGLSPLHLALQNGQAETALSLLEFDHNLARIKGKHGYTPFHYEVQFMRGNTRSVLTKILEGCPECIQDVTNRKETVFHLAARKNDDEVLKFLLQWLWSTSDFRMKQIKKILNSKNRDGDTVLHIAAYNNQPKIVKLLTQYKVVIDMKATNLKKFTALRILESGDHNEDNKECLKILHRTQRLNFVYVIPSFLTVHITHLADTVKNMSGDKSNALLVVTVLILTAAYQATLSPPGGVFQAESKDNTSLQINHPSGVNNTSNNNPISKVSEMFLEKPFAKAGSSVLKTSDFLWFFIPNIAAFCLSYLVTCFILIAILPSVFSFTLVLSLSVLLFCLLVSSVLIISPNPYCLDIMYHYVYILFYVVAFVMYLIFMVLLFKKLRQRIVNKNYMKKVWSFRA